MQEMSGPPDECVCGSCRACRMELLNVSDAEPDESEQVKLSPRAQKILDEGYYYDPRRATAVVPVGERPEPEWRSRERERRSSLRKQRQAERVKIDGHWVHPDAPHGTSMGISMYSCCCKECRTLNSANHKRRRHERQRRAAAEEAARVMAE